MTAADLSNLVVEVLHNRGDDNYPDWSVGSGFFVGTRFVLTALHNVDGPSQVLVRVHGTEEHTAAVCLQGDKDLVDLAVLEVSDVAVDVPALRYGAVDRSVPAMVKRCWAVGFPRFKERARDPKPLRLSAQVDGEIPTSENLDQPLLTLQVRRSPRSLPGSAVHESEWAGISGAAVFSGGNIIVGVITEHHLSEGESALTVVPITAIDLLPEAEATKWWELLGVDHQALVRLPDEVFHPVSGSSQTLSSIRFRRLDAARTLDIPQPLVLETHERLITIGRAPKNMLVLPEDDVSWEHGQIVLKESQYMYCHLSSSSRTMLRRKGLEQIFRPGKKEELPLRTQDRLTIGKTTFIVEFDLANEDTGYKTTAQTQENQNEPG